jgi:hypothetical protein
MYVPCHLFEASCMSSARRLADERLEEQGF